MTGGGTTMVAYYGFGASVAAFLIAFVAAGLLTVAFKLIYQAATPYNERTLIRDGNVAAALTLGGALIGYVLPVASALEHTVSLLEFALWAVLAGVIQIVAVTVVRMIVMRDFSDRIARGELAAAVYMASLSISIGVLNAACMTA
jgi:putative membrane protein